MGLGLIDDPSPLNAEGYLIRFLTQVEIDDRILDDVPVLVLGDHGVGRGKERMASDELFRSGEERLEDLPPQGDLPAADLDPLLFARVRQLIPFRRTMLERGDDMPVVIG